MHIEHVTIRVKDMEESLKFYSEIIGLKETRNIRPREGFNIVFLDDPKGGTVELIEDAGFNESFDYKKNDQMHIGFAVDSVEETMAFIKSKGIEIARGPIEGAGGVVFFYVYDPNGVLTQFIQL